MTQALQRDHWRKLAPIFVEQHDVPWATGQQPALTNLASNKRAPQRYGTNDGTTDRMVQHGRQPLTKNRQQRRTEVKTD